MEKKILTHGDVQHAVDLVASYIVRTVAVSGNMLLYGVPRGGIAPAYAVAAAVNALMGRSVTVVVDDPGIADVFIDDIADSHATMRRYQAMYNKPFLALFDNDSESPERHHDGWLVFPWEQTEDKGDESATDIITRMLQLIGEDPQREGLRETPQRVVKSWAEYFSGYGKDAGDVIKTFADGAEQYQGNEMVLVSDIPIYSHCEHHIAPIFGVAHIAYIPNGRVMGLSKFARLAEVFARRLQVQERLTNQIADAIDQHLQPKGVGVLLKCRHMCMEARGVNVHSSLTTTSALRGQLLLNPSSRDEFLQLVAAAERRQ